MGMYSNWVKKNCLKSKPSTVLITVLLHLFFYGHVNAQDLGKLKDQKPFAISGSLFAYGSMYSNFDTGPIRQSPYTYLISGSPVISIYGIKIPITLTFQNQRFSYSQPFNRFGASPQYKWVKLHLGYSNMTFSPYTVAGQTFLGAGVELTPGDFRFSAFYGKLTNMLAQRDSAVVGTDVVNTFDRKMHGIKVGYGNSKNSIDLMYIKVKDDVNSASKELVDNGVLLPEDNFVLGLDGKFSVTKQLSFGLESAFSLHTGDAEPNIELNDSRVKQIVESASWLLKVNGSTRWGIAGKAFGKLQYKKWGIGITYNRINPYFRSLGLYFIQTDIENTTGNINLKLLKNRLSLRANLGFQRDNLTNMKRATNVRKIGSFFIQYTNPKGFSLSGNYGNYQIDQQAGYIIIDDSIRMALVNENFGLSGVYSWKSKTKRHSLSLNLNHQTYKDVNELRVVSLVDNVNITGNLSYRVTIKPKKLTLRFGTNYYNFKMINGTNQRFGGTVGAGYKTRNKKMNVSGKVSWNKSLMNNIDDGYVLRINGRIGYKLTKKQQLSFTMSWLNRASKVENPLTELRTGLRYGISF